MKKLCCEKDLESCHELKALLESRGIPCVVKSPEQVPLFEARGLSRESALPELWVSRDEQFEEAWAILNGAAEPEADSGPCADAGEE